MQFARQVADDVCLAWLSVAVSGAQELHLAGCRELCRPSRSFRGLCQPQQSVQRHPTCSHNHLLEKGLLSTSSPLLKSDVTNAPCLTVPVVLQDLDEACLRRFGRRIFCDLPSRPARQQILQVTIAYCTDLPHVHHPSQQQCLPVLCC